MIWKKIKNEFFPTPLWAMGSFEYNIENKILTFTFPRHLIISTFKWPDYIDFPPLTASLNRHSCEFWVAIFCAKETNFSFHYFLWTLHRLLILGTTAQLLNLSTKWALTFSALLKQLSKEGAISSQRVADIGRSAIIRVTNECFYFLLVVRQA